MSRELRELRIIRQQLERDKPINRNVNNCGNTIIKLILLGGVLILFIFLILLTMIMY